jgi:hypothetical protein
MARKSNAVSVRQAAAVAATETEVEMNSKLRTIVREIDGFFTDAQSASLTAFWEIGRRIARVSANPDEYLTQAQKDMRMSVRLRCWCLFLLPCIPRTSCGAPRRFTRNIPSQGELDRLRDLRCPEKPHWRLSTSHVQLLSGRR